jgi:hypothetical protein
MRVVIAFAAVCLAITPAICANAQVESAKKTFQSISADPAKTKKYCEMAKVMEDAGDQADEATEAKIQTLIKDLGPDFESAWNTGGELDENSEDAKVYNAALDELSNKCT